MRGVLQMPAGTLQKLPAGSVATVLIRVVGRNTKGPLASVQVPLDASKFPVEYAISSSELREGLPDYIWREEDIYIKADAVTPAGKTYAEGRSKAKAVMGDDGKPTHKTAYLTLE